MRDGSGAPRGSEGLRTDREELLDRLLLLSSTLASIEQPRADESEQIAEQVRALVEDVRQFLRRAGWVYGSHAQAQLEGFLTEIAEAYSVEAWNAPIGMLSNLRGFIASLAELLKDSPGVPGGGLKIGTLELPTAEEPARKFPSDFSGEVTRYQPRGLTSELVDKYRDGGETAQFVFGLEESLDPFVSEVQDSIKELVSQAAIAFERRSDVVDLQRTSQAIEALNRKFKQYEARVGKEQAAKGREGINRLVFAAIRIRDEILDALQRDKRDPDLEQQFRDFNFAGIDWEAGAEIGRQEEEQQQPATLEIVASPDFRTIEVAGELFSFAPEEGRWIERCWEYCKQFGNNRALIPKKHIVQTHYRGTSRNPKFEDQFKLEKRKSLGRIFDKSNRGYLRFRYPVRIAEDN